MNFASVLKPMRCLVWMILCLATALAAEPYKVGDKLEPFTVKDAKDVEFTYEPGKLSCLIVSYAMSPGKAVNTYLTGKPADFLETHHTAYLANIYGMPGIGRFFALPKMKKYAHRILLADSETLLARHPIDEKRINVFTFDANGVITAIRQLDPEKDLDKAFKPASATP